MTKSSPKENSQILAQEIETWATEVFKMYSQKDLEDSAQLRQALKLLKGLTPQLERRIK